MGYYESLSVASSCWAEQEGGCRSTQISVMGGWVKVGQRSRPKLAERRRESPLDKLEDPIRR